MDNTPLLILFSMLVSLLCGYVVLAARGGFSRELNPRTLPKEYDLEKGYRLLFHTDTLIQNRLNAFLLTESIFLAAIATLWDKVYVMKSISGLALIVTMALWHSLSQLELNYSTIANAQKQCPVYKFYRTRGEADEKGISSLVITVWIVPYVTVMAWILILLLRC